MTKDPEVRQSRIYQPTRNRNPMFSPVLVCTGSTLDSVANAAVELSCPPLARSEMPGISQSGAHDIATTSQPTATYRNAVTAGGKFDRERE